MVVFAPRLPGLIGKRIAYLAATTEPAGGSGAEAGLVGSLDCDDHHSQVGTGGQRYTSS